MSCQIMVSLLTLIMVLSKPYRVNGYCRQRNRDRDRACVLVHKLWLSTNMFLISIFMTPKHPSILHAHCEQF